MKVQQISNQPNFQGTLTVNGLSKSQQKVFDSIRDEVSKKVADKDFLILHIDGSISPSYVARDYNLNPKYAIMHTQVKSAASPTASTYTDSSNPNEWLKKINKLIDKHLESDTYQRALNGEFDSFWTKIKKSFLKLINKEK